MYSQSSCESFEKTGARSPWSHRVDRTFFCAAFPPGSNCVPATFNSPEACSGSRTIPSSVIETGSFRKNLPFGLRAITSVAAESSAK